MREHQSCYAMRKARSFAEIGKEQFWFLFLLRQGVLNNLMLLGEGLKRKPELAPEPLDYGMFVVYVR